MKAEVVVAGELLESGMETGDDGWAPSKAGREMTEEVVGGRVGSVSGGPSGWRR
jgi:hypothetical protein